MQKSDQGNAAQEAADKLSLSQVPEFFHKYIDMVVDFTITLVIALVVLRITLWVANSIVRFLNRAMEKREVEITLRKFLLDIIHSILRLICIIIFASMIGIETASLIALLGAAGLAVGLALQGSLSNFAGGILILMYRPFKAGDFIEAQGQSGTVEEIQIFNTVLKTPDNKKVFIPNGMLSNGSLVNYSAENTRRVDFVVSVSYDDSIKLAKQVIGDLLDKEKRILSDKSRTLVVGAHGANSVDLYVRVWVNRPDYWDVYFDFMENIKLAFDENGLTIPYPQQDVYIHQVANKE
ncbi:mechanosensitive ion channel family protein [Thalassotalea mangrovi]|uniref:Small-conductance mechanosensitive channel n=1 Tax=Thalassotalea mangrovi TaxID=2572245 RepID=A0A4U1B6W4_9GAMM|nr:mechanosensitive ion channel domain-containing protein [Thalassotalea mangrovi]TKB46307.1 mechanosensitive ion channel [Thalassotalea mangrovi]